MSERVKGNRGIIAKFTTGATTHEFDGDLKKIELTSEDRDSDDVTFAEAAQGDLKDFTAELTAIQSTTVGSLWRFLWENPGVEVEVVYGPHGNAVPTEEKPHFHFSAKNTGRPTLGGEATTDETGFEFEHELTVTSEIELVDSAV